MSNKLFESNFVSVNIQPLFANRKSVNEPQVATTDTKSDEQKDDTNLANKQTIKDWGDELNKRLDTNHQMSRGARKPDYEIESEFFKEYFNALWDADCATQLFSIGEPLRKALKVLGFKKATNPILCFISLNYVQEKLIRTKLLNVNTFKAVYSAIANKCIAKSELLRASDYNILYCPDLYTKSVTDIENYLKLQSYVLRVSAKTYTTDIQSLNKKAFFYIGKIKEQDIQRRVEKIKALTDDFKLPSAKSSLTKLNNYNLAKKMIENVGGISTPSTASATTQDAAAHMSTNTQKEILDKLQTIDHLFAAVQFLSMTTKNKDAAKALTNKTFSNVSINALKEVTTFIPTILPKGSLVDKEVSELVSSIINKAESL